MKGVQLCQFQNGRYDCKSAPRHLLQKVTIPADACYIKDCSHCVRGKETYLISDDQQLIVPERFMIEVDKRKQPSKGQNSFFKCNVTTEEECDCRGNMCTGDSDFCDLFPCSTKPTKCYCSLTHEEATILHFTETQTLTNPAQITFDTCLFDKRQTHQKRRLLEHEEARFSSHNLTIKFIDPVLHVPEPGRVILRTEEYEHFISITDELQITLPFELLAYKTELTLIYINQKGFAVSGVIHIAGKSACQLTQCIFCSEGLRTIKCWPAPVQYAAYGLILGTVVLILCCVRTILKLIISILKSTCIILCLVFRIVKAIARLFLLLGSFLGVQIRHTGHTVHEALERGANGEVNKKLLLLAVCSCVMVLPAANADCSDHAILSSELQHCETSSPEFKTCRLTTTAELTLTGLQHETCLWLQDTKKTQIVSIKIKLTAVTCDFHTKRQYFTFPVTPNYLSQVSCYQNYWCGRGEHCKMSKLGFDGLRFEGETLASREYTGRSSCSPGGLGSGCFLYTRSSCNFYRVWYVPDLLESFEVSTITGHTCSYHLSLEHVDNHTVTHVTVKDSTITPSGIQIKILGAFSQPQVHLTESFVQRVGNPNEAYLIPTSLKNVPKLGEVGVIQANVSYTKAFIFDSLITTCDFFETSLRCQTAPDPVTLMKKSKEHALPITRDLHMMRVTDGRLSSSLLSTSAVKIQLHFSNYKLTVETRTVCPKFSKTQMEIGGCYSCGHLARITFPAVSTCQSGLVTVEFQEIQVHTKALRLSTEETTLTIKFLAEKKCIKDKLCLRANTLIQCQTFEACFDEPSIELVNLNTNYTRTPSLDSTGSWTDWISIPALGNAFFLFKFLGAGLLCVCLGITIVSTCVTCCGKR